EEVDIRQIAESLEQELQRTEGVASVTVSGEIVEEVQIELDAQKLEQNNLTQNDVMQIIQASNISMPGAELSTNENQLLTTRVVSLFTSPEEIADVVLSVNPLTGEAIKVQDIANVERKEQETNTITRANDRQAVLISVLQESGANTANVSETFQKELGQLLGEPQYEGIEATILFRSEEHTSELQSRENLVCRLLLEKKK